MNQDLQHLNLLAIFHYVLGGLLGLFGCIPFIHVTMGILMIQGKLNDGPNPPPPALGWLFVGLGALFIVFAWSVTIAMIVAGRKLNAQRSHTYCFIIACLECLWMPLGTILGVFTIIVLSRPTVKELFKQNVDVNPP